MKKEKSSYFIEFSEKFSEYVSAEFKPDFIYKDSGKIVIQQKDGKKLTIHDAKWFDWMVLRIYTQDMEVDELKERYRFSYN
ncbi:MAG: hypothetical protein ACI33N_01125 [Desulfovibrionaceae bacterium]